MLAVTSFIEDPITVFLTGLTLMILFFWYFATEVERRKRNVGTVLLIGLTALCVMAATPVHERLKGGIDIIGGSAFTLRIQEKETDTGEKMPITREQVEQAIIVIEKRLNVMGTAEPLITQQGANGILVQMPGVEPEESARIRETLEKVAKLELRKVSERSEEPDQEGKTLAERVLNEGEIAVGERAYRMKGKDEDGNEYQRPILLSRRTALGGSDIANAVASPQQNDAVAITLNNEGTDKMIALTQNMREGIDRIAIVLDGEVVSAPVVNQVPLGKQFIIEGLREPGEVQRLANQLMNPLENPLVVEEMRNVSPTLGAAVVRQGLMAGLLSLGLTYIFLLLYYRFSGVVATIGLTVNGVILFGVMAMFGFTFSLPGIAGMILTIGMAVDANVLIYERLREEIASGKSLKHAIDSAYEKAFSAIFDSNITSLITAVILFALGSGTIKGFAITLTIGLTASMFSALLVTRVLFRWGNDLKLIKKLSFLQLIKKTNFDFMGKRRIYAVIAGVLILASFAGFFIRGERALGIDFTGGTRIMFQLGDEARVPLVEVNKALDAMKLSKAAYPQEESNPASGTLLTVRCATEDAAAITEKMREIVPVLGEREADGEGYRIDASTEEVSAVIGGSFMRQSIIAIVFGLIGIMLYMTARFEFSFALGGFVAIIHDLIIAVGIIVMLGGELSLIHVGAILTIAGYSINDTIIVFDRIRESVLVRTGSIEKIMNDAINATLSRTLITSVSTLFSTAILAILGGSALRDFGFIIFIGIVIGTFSSIFVASPIVLWWSRRKGGDVREEGLASAAKAESIASAP
jgi:SecD/SecF fusion protein